MDRSNKQRQNLYLETKLGIITQTGDWFHTTADHIKRFVPGLLKKRPLDQLVQEAVAWVRSADSLALTLLLILLMVIPPLFAVVIAVAFHFFWYRFKSGFVTIYTGKLLKFMNTDGYLLITSLIIISYLGLDGRYIAGGVGLAFFFLMKLGLLKGLWDKIDEHKSDELSLNDRIFKMVLIKYAMHYNIAPTEVQNMEEKFKELATSRKRGKN
ncbi:MAG TPA: hypothetical protein VK112_06450 [Fodinibius sp.]|nr:hypothetical protein [Fodinibius sp.]